MRTEQHLEKKEKDYVLISTEFTLQNGEGFHLSKESNYLLKLYGLDTYFSRMIKLQDNLAIKRQLFQHWQLKEVKNGELCLSIKDRYGEPIVLESYPFQEKKVPQLSFFKVGNVVYTPDELIIRDWS